MEIVGFLIVAAIIFIIVVYVINAGKNVKATFTQKSKEASMPMSTTDNIGREYSVLGMIDQSGSYLPRVKVEFINKAEKLGADAIVGVQAYSQTQGKNKLNKGALNISNDPRFYKVERVENTTYNMTGTAVKFI